jgi:hypothetical protein
MTTVFWALVFITLVLLWLAITDSDSMMDTERLLWFYCRVAIVTALAFIWSYLWPPGNDFWDSGDDY